MWTDSAGRLHLPTVNVSRAAVNTYRGREIPDWDKLGLDSERVYKLLRPELELAHSTHSWNGLPITIGHSNTKSEVVGLLGDGCRYLDPTLYNSAVLWAPLAMDGLHRGSLRQLSGTYDYKPDMTPGKWRGQVYDGVMRDIVGAYVALVHKSRTGDDMLATTCSGVWQDDL